MVHVGILPSGWPQASATGRVKGQSPYRRGEYYRKELAIANTNTAMFSNVTCTGILAGVTNSSTGKVFLARSPEVFSYDADGNLTQDGRWNYTWDGENRLVRMLSVTNTPTNSWYSLDFAYDAQGRRVSKTVSNWNGAAWAKKCDQRFVYDRWNLLATLSSDLSLQSSFTWGLDLSGSPHGAGGVGGLLGLNDTSNGVFFVAYDGNGNVAALVNATNGNVSAQYEYGPFGEVIRATGPMAKANPFRFSTKYQEDEIDLFYYGYRYYSATMGRWLSRDPLGEMESTTLYAFLSNDGIGAYDRDGRRTGPGRPVPGWRRLPPYAPPHEGQPCPCLCARLPAQIQVRLVDMSFSASPFRLELLFDKKRGCYKDLEIRWDTCIRPGGQSGYLPSFDDSLTFHLYPGPPGAYGSWRVNVFVRYLYCNEEARWEKAPEIWLNKQCQELWGLMGSVYICD